MLTSANKLFSLTPITRQSFVFRQNDSWQKTAAKAALWISSIASAGLAGYLAYQYGPSFSNKVFFTPLQAPAHLSTSTPKTMGPDFNQGASAATPPPAFTNASFNTTETARPDFNQGASAATTPPAFTNSCFNTTETARPDFYQGDSAAPNCPAFTNSSFNTTETARPDFYQGASAATTPPAFTNSSLNTTHNPIDVSTRDMLISGIATAAGVVVTAAGAVFALMTALTD